LAPALEADEGTKEVPLMTLHKSKALERHTVIFVDLGDLAWRSYAQNTARRPSVSSRRSHAPSSGSSSRIPPVATRAGASLRSTRCWRPPTCKSLRSP